MTRKPKKKPVRNLSLEENINKAFEHISNIEPSFKDKIYKEVLSLDNVKNTSGDVLKIVKQLMNMPPIAYGSKTKNYWINRGWTEAEARYKARNSGKPIERRTSPFNYLHWVEKGYSEEEAKFKANSIRPIRKEYWLVKGYSEEEAIKLAAETKDKNNKLGADKSASRPLEESRASSPRCIEYYLIRGFSKKEAVKKVKEHQVTFSLDKCIEKYGEEKGRARWIKRQEKWLKSLANKTPE